MCSTPGHSENWQSSHWGNKLAKQTKKSKIFGVLFLWPCLKKKLRKIVQPRKPCCSTRNKLWRRKTKAALLRNDLKCFKSFQDLWNCEVFHRDPRWSRPHELFLFGNVTQLFDCWREKKTDRKTALVQNYSDFLKLFIYTVCISFSRDSCSFCKYQIF